MERRGTPRIQGGGIDRYPTGWRDEWRGEGHLAYREDWGVGGGDRRLPNKLEGRWEEERDIPHTGGGM